jgi:hypothetical protein
VRLTSYQIADLRAAAAGQILLTSAGFEFDGALVESTTRERLDRLWMDDYLDADIKGVEEPALVVLTSKGEQELARAEQESQR